MKNILVKKALLIFGLILILMIALSMTSDLINERYRFKQEAKNNIASSWTGEQKFIGPFLVVPYFVEYSHTVWDKDLKRDVLKISTASRKHYIIPEQLNIEGLAKTQMRYRGLYAVPVYSSSLTINGHFSNKVLRNKVSKENKVVKWGKPYLSVYISDSRGISYQPELQWQEQSIAFSAGAKLAIIDRGMHADLPVLDLLVNRDYAFSFSLDLRGMESLSFSPIGMNTEVKLKSDWPHPSFIGSYLPEQREISDDGFSSAWRVSSFSSNVTQQINACLKKKCGSLINNSFGVSMLQPVDIYQQAERSIKYGILFISLTFIAFWIFEIIKKLSIHPVQYLLVGFALSIFYLLLVALSEHMAFSWAYFIAAFACTGLLSFYLAGVLQSVRASYTFTAVIALLYGVLYIIICLENTALLMGSGLLFMSLCILMIITRNIDWYSIAGNNDTVEYDAIK